MLMNHTYLSPQSSVIQLSHSSQLARASTKKKRERKSDLYVM